MPTLYFKIGADYEAVIRLRDEIKKLENQLKSFGKSTPEPEIRKIEEHLASTKQQMMGLVTEAAKAGVAMENDLKRKIDSVTKSSDELSSEIIKQRTIIRETQEDVRRLSEQYSKMGKYSPQSTSTLNQLNKAKSALNEQKYALGELQDQQARNRLELRQLTREYRDFSQGTDKATVTVDALMSSLKRTAAEIGGLAAIRKFGMDVIDATGKMQQLQVALSTILQSKSKADALLAEVSEFAKKTPFNLDDVANGAKQLLAYGSSAENVVDELSMLGDVASGLQIPLGSLIYLYGTLRVQGRAYWRDIQQFQGRGVNVVEEMAKNLGVTQDQIKKLVEEGKIGFKDVEKAFQSMTSEGGKFNNMLENAAGTWPQRIANLEDTLFTKLVDFGNKYKEVFEFGIGTAEELVEHLDDVISVIGSLIAAYGSYKAALIAVAAWQKAGNLLSMAKNFFSLAKGVNVATAAMKAFNVASKANLFGALLSIITGVTTAVYMFTKRTNEATAAQEALSKVNKKADEEFLTQAATIDRLNGVLRSETASLDQKKKALGELQSIIPDYNASLNEEGKLINNNTEAIEAYLTQLEKQIKLKAAQEELEELYRNKRIQEKDVQKQQANYERVREQNTIGVVYGGDAGIEVQRASLNRIANSEKSLKKAEDKLKNTQTQIAAIKKEIEQTSLSDKKDKPQSSISKELENVTKRIKTLKQEIADLRSGKLQAEVGKTVESTIKAKEKELKAANETLETLTGKKQSESKSVSFNKNQQNFSNELLSIRKENEDREVELIQDGTERQLAEIKLRYDREIAEVEKLEEELKQAQGGGLTEEQQNLFTSTYSGIEKARNRDIKAVNDKEKEEEYKRIKEQEDAWNEYMMKFGDYQQKRQAIVEKYNNQIEEAQTAGDAAILYKEQQNALDELDNSIKGSTTLMGQLFADASEKSVNEIQKIIDKAELLMDYLGATKDEQGNANINGEQVSRKQILDLGISENSLQNLELSTEEVEALQKAIKRLRGEMGSKSPFKLFENQVKDAANLFKQGGKDNIAKGVTQLGNAVTEFSPALSQFGKDLGNIFGSDDFGNKAAGIAEAIGGLGQTAAGVGQAMSGDIVGGVMSAVGGISSIVSAFEGLFGADYSQYYEMKDRYDQLSEVWDVLISKKQEYIDISYGAEALKAGQEALNLLEMKETEARQLAWAAADAGSSVGSHSIAYRQNRDLAQYTEELKKYTTQRESLTNMLINSTAEELATIRDKMPEMWVSLDSDFRDALEQIIETGEESEEVIENMKAAMTGVDFSSFQDSFVDMLSDLDSTNQDFADNFEKYLQNAIFSSLVANKYKDEIQALYDDWARYTQDEAKLSETEANDLRKRYEGIVNGMLTDRENIMKDFGWTSSEQEQQSASKGGFDTMTQDQATELSGRFTAVAESNYRIEGAITELSGSISAMTASVTGMYNIADETRSILANSYLELQEINENTGNSAKYLKDIKDDIAIVKRNTSRL